MRLIDADALIQKRNHAKAYAKDMYVIGQGYVMDAPTISAVPVVRGEWIKKSSELTETLALCSKCSYPISWWHKSNYCPNCGSYNGGDKA